MPENDTGKTANSTPASPEDAPKLDRRAAIAQARAIRREAAAKAGSNKERAAEAANSILEQAAPEPPRQPMHKQTAPVPVSNSTGRFGWLDEMRKPAVARANADEIVEQLIAEAEERASRPKSAAVTEPEVARKALVDQIVAESTPEVSDADTIVAQVLAETARSQSVQLEQLSYRRARPDISRAVSTLDDVRVEKKPAPVQVENVMQIGAPFAGIARPQPVVHGAAPAEPVMPPRQPIPPKAVHADVPVQVTETDAPDASAQEDNSPAEPVIPVVENEIAAEEAVAALVEEIAAEVEESAAPAEDEISDETEESAAPAEDEISDETDESAAAAEDEISAETEESAAPAEDENSAETKESAAPAEDEISAETEESAAAAEDEISAETEESAAAAEDEIPAPAPRYRRYNDSAAPDNTGAAEDYRQATRDARGYVKKLSRKTERAWSKEASSHRAAETEHRTEKRAAVWNIAACLLLLFGTAAGMILLERPTISAEENRMLATMPAFTPEGWLDGSYTNGVSEYYNDTVPYRSVFKSWTQKLRTLLGIQGLVIHGSVAAPAAAPEETTAETTVTTLQTEPGIEVTTTRATTAVTEDAPEEEPVQGAEMSGGILISNKRGIMLFGGWESMGENYANILNRFQADLPDVKMYNMVIPTNCSFYTPPEYQNLITSEKANIDYINNHLEGVIPVDAYSALEKHKDEPIFMRTDHHWSSLGSFYAAEKFSAAARVPFAPMSDYDRHAKEGYVGTLYTFSNDIILKNNPEEFFWYVPHAQFKTTYYNRSYGNPHEGSLFMDIENTMPVSWYMVYIAGDDHIVHVETETKNNRRLAVIKDSYGNALIPWLTSSFEEIYVIDMRYFDLNAVRFMQEHNITDVLFTMNSFSANSANADAIEKIRVQ